jgi:putative oxidoreductase
MSQKETKHIAARSQGHELGAYRLREYPMPLFDVNTPLAESPMSTFSPYRSQPTASVSFNPSKESTMNTDTTNTVKNVSELVGRSFLAVLFLLSGLSKIGAYAGTVAYMSSVGVPGAVLPVVIATEVLGALAIIVGWKTRVIASLLASFSLLAAAIFHNNFGDQIQMIMFLKNVSIAGGFLLLVANGAGPLSIDRRLAK